MQNSKNTKRYFEELLESDDELPTKYEETPDIPAYQLDSRFEPIKFTWIDSNFSKYYQENQLEDKPKLSVLYSSLNKDFLLSKTQNLKPEEKCLVLNSVLSEQDLYCLKCIEVLANDSFFLWLVNFLMYKDLQSNFSFLKTCLVSTPVSSLSNKINLEKSDIKNFNFEFIYNEQSVILT